MARLLPLLALAALALSLSPPPAYGVQVVGRDQGPPPQAPVFDNGKDVFGRLPTCRACHAMLEHTLTSLVPKLRDARAREERRRAGPNNPAARRQEFGTFEGIIQDYVPQACMFPAVFHNKPLLKACERIREEHEDDLIDAFYAWSQAVPEPEEWDWNFKVCYEATGACPKALAMHSLEEFRDDGSGGSERTYRSEPRPERGERVDEHGVVKAVAATLHEEVAEGAAAGRDVVMYFSYAKQHEDFHWMLLPTLRRLATLLSGNATAAQHGSVAHFDCDTNDPAPPYGEGVTRPAVVLYPAGNKRTPRFMTLDPDLEEARVTLFDLLQFLLNAGGATPLRRWAYDRMADPGIAYDDKFRTYDDVHDEL